MFVSPMVGVMVGVKKGESSNMELTAEAPRTLSKIFMLLTAPRAPAVAPPTMIFDAPLNTGCNSRKKDSRIWEPK
jgi:hypothetical protein